jgi:hypothetical protein
MATRKKTIDQVNAARKRQGLKPGIFHEKNSRANVSTLRSVLQKLQSRIKEDIRSHTKVNKRHTATQVATRFLVRDLIGPMRKQYNLTNPQVNILSQIIEMRTYTFPKTNIQVRPNHNYLVLKLVNELGEQKCEKIFKRIAKRGEGLKKIAIEVNKPSSNKTDVYSNLSQSAAGNPIMALQILQMNKGNYAKQVENFINQRKEEAKQVTLNPELKAEERNKIQRTLNRQALDAMKELITFRQKYRLDW